MVIAAALAFCAMSAGAAERFTLTRLGEEIIDTKQKLSFKRCPEYQAWQVNQCIGTRPDYTFTLALERAKQVADESGLAWRLPTQKELQGLFEITAEKTTLASKLFPLDAQGTFWTSSKISSYPDSIWTVKFNSGDLGEASKSKSVYPVRLVRSLN